MFQRFPHDLNLRYLDPGKNIMQRIEVGPEPATESLGFEDWLIRFGVCNCQQGIYLEFRNNMFPEAHSAQRNMPLSEALPSEGKIAMSDNLTNRVQPDRSKINMHEDHEVKYWSHALGVSREMLQRAVDKVGNSAAAVRKELGLQEPSKS